MLSATWQYSVRALTHLAMAKETGPVLAIQIAETEGIPLPFLSKILHQLKVAGIVGATRGQRGGYTIIRDPSKITLLTIAHLTDHVDFGEQCLLGYKFCDSHTNCTLHPEWEGIKKIIHDFLKTVTIDRLAKDATREALDITGMLHSKQPPLRPPYQAPINT
jgi:Rrf2 family protein